LATAFGLGLIAIVEPKRANVRIGACHRGDRFRLESLILNKR
jgi:hypothetical protein